MDYEILQMANDLPYFHGIKRFYDWGTVSFILLDQIFYKSETFPAIILLNGFTDSTTNK